MHCGLCLEECPTYLVGGNETNSPRGRLLLMRAHAQGELQFEDIAGPLDKCLSCRACESACPSGVPYGALLEEQRDGHQAPLLKFILRRVLNSWLLLRTSGFLTRLCLKLGVIKFLSNTGPKKLQAMCEVVPTEATTFKVKAGQTWAAHGQRRGRVGLHLGCVSSQFFGQVLSDTIKLYTQQGFEVHCPAQAPCCGAVHAHSGDSHYAKHLAAKTLAAFDDSYDAVLVTSAGCAGHLREAQAATLIQDPLVFLHRQGLRGAAQEVAMNAVYSPPCHLTNVLKESGVLAKCLEQVPGLRLSPLNEAELCCGAGGINFIQQAGVAKKVGKRKVDNIKASGAEYVINSNPICLMKLSADLKRHQLGVIPIHPVTILAQAFTGTTE